MPSLTRGPLPSSVYWRRRLVIITIALLLVVGIAKLLGGGGGGGSRSDAAKLSDQGSSTLSTSPTPSAAPTSPPVTTRPYVPPTVTYGPSAPPVAASPPTAAGSTKAPSGTPTSALPEPVGDCSASDVAVTPSVSTAYAYESVTVALQLHTLTATACTWHVSPDALQVEISRKGGQVWSTVECPAAIPSTDVVVRRDSLTTLPVVWQGHRVVADSCSAHAPWSTPGTLTVVASSLGGEPAQTTFPLLAPGEPSSASSSPTTSPTASPTTSPKTSPKTSQTRSPSGQT